jgi:hypothetical protein
VLQSFPIPIHSNFSPTLQPAMDTSKIGTTAEFPAPENAYLREELSNHVPGTRECLYHVPAPGQALNIYPYHSHHEQNI